MTSTILSTHFQLGTDAGSRERIFPPATLLVVGAVLTVLSGMRWNVAALAWLQPIPFLLYVRQSSGWRSKLVFMAVLGLAMHLQVAKIVTPPLPVFALPMFALPVTIFLGAVYLGWGALARRVDARLALYAFPAMMALAVTLQHRFTDFGVWGAATNTQIENLPFLQLASLFGISGTEFLMGWAASLAAAVLAQPNRRTWRIQIGVFVLALAAALTFGTMRSYSTQGQTMELAGVVADLGLTPHGPPNDTEVAANNDALFARSERAAETGARLVVWNEGATIVEAADETAFIARGAELAARRHVDLVLAYIIPTSREPFRFENKYVWIGDDGQTLQTYRKHHPPPGEPSTADDAPLAALDRPYGRVAGAICYDYDFPMMALEHATLGAGLVVVPSSDWRGIDPYHTQMARLRAIEGGFSVFRPVRAATSAAFDAYGRVRASMPFFENNGRVFTASVPTERIPTLYAVIGDLPAVLCAFYLLLVCAVAALGRRRPAST